MAKKVPKIPKEYEQLYNRETCQKCFQPVTKKRMLECKKKRFWPVCKECEIKITPMVIKAQKMLAEKQEQFL